MTVAVAGLYFIFLSGWFCFGVSAFSTGGFTVAVFHAVAELC